MFSGTYCKKKKKKKKNTTENLVTPAPPTPDKGSIREIATGEITVSITPDDHLEGPCLLKIRELPGGRAKMCCLVSAILRGNAATKPERAKRPSEERVW